METYDDVAFEKFCSALVNAGFSPIQGTEQSRWRGPLRESLRSHTEATRMEIKFYAGWPFRYAHVIVDGLRAEHASNGIICLWAEDDPAQVSGRDIEKLWVRLDEWATTAEGGFRAEDRALDAYLLFDEVNSYQAELPFGDLVRKGNNGYREPLFATLTRANVFMIEPGHSPVPDVENERQLKGVFYLRRDIGVPPRNFEDVRVALTRKQKQDLKYGLNERAPTALAEPSGGYDFIVLAWPRHDQEHDAIVIGFEGGGETLRASALAATPNDDSARRRRAGPDVKLLSEKKILIAGAGSVGGHVAVALASSGVGTIHIHDNDYLKTSNLVRHVSSKYLVGYKKTLAMSMAIGDHAPWTTVEQRNHLPFDPSGLSSQLEGLDLIIDCTGNIPLTAALAEVCRKAGVSLITGALFHQGALARVQRQSDGDIPIAGRPADHAYYALPPEDPHLPNSGFLELGCTAPINKAPPIAVLSTAAEIAYLAVDFLTGRRERPAERIIVFRPMTAPFDRTGTFDAPRDAADVAP